jgi:signal transduction histidine kinase
MIATTELSRDNTARTTAGLIRQLCDRTHRTSGSEAAWGPQLDVVCDRATEAAARFESEFGSATQWLHGPLHELLADAWQDTAPAARLRELRRITCALSCVLDNLFRAEDGLDPRELSVRYSEIDLAYLTSAACEAFLPLARERRIEFCVQLPDEALAEVDGKKIQLVVLNLLFNAFKYTPEGGSIECRLHAPHGADELVVSVTDSGQGIAGDELETIFDRVGAHDRAVRVAINDLGFSLARSRDLVALHGGLLRARSRGSVSGADFCLSLPRWAPPGVVLQNVDGLSPVLPRRVARVAADELAVEARIGLEPPIRDHRPLVLIIEDNRPIQRLLIDSLEEECSVVSAFSGDDGLRLARECRPDLIVADLELPLIDSDALVRAIRSVRELDDIPIVALTSCPESARAVALLETTVQDLVGKPLVVPEVRVRIRNLIEAKRARDLLNELSGQRETDLVRLAGQVSRHQEKLRVALEQISVARELAESASQIKSNFLRMVSHELKTPVTAMQLQLALLDREGGGAMSQAVREGLTRISRSSRKLVHLVDTMIEWARIESGRCSVRGCRFELVDLLDDVVTELCPYAEAKGSSIRVRSTASSAPPLVSDPRLVRLIILNLLGYAIQRTDHGVIEIATEYAAGQHRMLVADQGPAIPQEERVELFEPLSFSVDLRRRHGCGSGLGLYVVRDLARAVGGEILIVEDGGADRVQFAAVLPSTPQPTPHREESHVASEQMQAGAGAVS